MLGKKVFVSEHLNRKTLLVYPDRGKAMSSPKIISFQDHALIDLLPELRSIETELFFGFQGLNFSHLSREKDIRVKNYNLLVYKKDEEVLALMELLPGSGPDRTLINAFEVILPFRRKGHGETFLGKILLRLIHDGKIVELDVCSELLPFYRRVTDAVFQGDVRFSVSAGTNEHQEYRVTIGRD